MEKFQITMKRAYSFTKSNLGLFLGRDHNAINCLEQNQERIRGQFLLPCIIKN